MSLVRHCEAVGDNLMVCSDTANRPPWSLHKLDCWTGLLCLFASNNKCTDCADISWKLALQWRHQLSVSNCVHVFVFFDFYIILIHFFLISQLFGRLIKPWETHICPELFPPERVSLCDPRWLLTSALCSVWTCWGWEEDREVWELRSKM